MITPLRGDNAVTSGYTVANISHHSIKENQVMKTNTLSLSGNTAVVGGLAVLAAGLAFAVLTGRQLPLISGDRAASVALLIIGFAMCTFGSLQGIQPHEWLHPMNILASLLGVLALLLGVVVLTGAQVPLISGERAAFVALAVIIIAKVALAAVHHTWFG
jgi:hypothetical protein